MNGGSPLWLKVERGDALTLTERIRWAWGHAIVKPLTTFVWRIRITPPLRERCVDYALRAGSTGWNVPHDAERLARFIGSGEDR